MLLKFFRYMQLIVYSSYSHNALKMTVSSFENAWAKLIIAKHILTSDSEHRIAEVTCCLHGTDKH